MLIKVGHNQSFITMAFEVAKNVLYYLIWTLEMLILTIDVSTMV